MPTEELEDVIYTESEPTSSSSKDAEVQCDPKVLFDAECQCDRPFMRSTATRTLAKQKHKNVWRYETILTGSLGWTIQNL